MIEARGLVKRLGGRAVLAGVDLSVKDGETVVLLGRSGSGKSVFLKHAIGLLPVEEGTLSVLGQDVTHAKAALWNRIRREVAMVFQGSALFDSMSVGDNVALAMRQHTRMSEAEVEARVIECLGFVGLADTQALKPSSLSGGMRKRVGIARAIALKPRLLLYDEPTSGLDPVTSDVINRLVRRLQKETGVSSIVVTHDMQSAYMIADRVALLHQGRIRFDGTPDAIRRSTDPIVRQFVEGTSLDLTTTGESMASRNAEIAVGVTVLIAAAVVVWSVTFLRQVRLAEGTRVWHVRFSDVGGLAEDDPVSVNGVKKGTVRAITLAPGGSVVVDFRATKDVGLLHGDRVFVRNVGLMGEKFIAIDRGPGGPAYDAKRDTIVGVYESGIPEVVSQMGTALSALERLSDEIDRVLALAEDKNTVRTSLGNIQAASADLRRTLADSHDNFVAVAANLRAASESARRMAETNEPKVSRALDDVSRTSARMDSLLARVDTLSIALASVTRKIDSGNGTAAQLLNEHALYDDTRRAVNELTALVRDLRTNPKKYFKVSVF